MKNYNKTIYACFTGYIVQAIVNNFIPLLFLTIQKEYDISLSKITMLITINFAVQLGVDLLSVAFVDKIGYRAAAVLAHSMAALGFVLLTILPEVFEYSYLGFLIAVICYAVGGGILEVIISPMVEACPTKNKEKAMSLLHSFYCWGHVGVVFISTVFFFFVGIEHWKVLALVWALIPLTNAIAFLKVPIASLLSEDEEKLPLKSLISKHTFWIFMLLMFCAGACEQAVSQWASTFAEKGLGVSKAIGDLAGPMLFAILMGASRVFYGKYGEKIDLEKFMFYSTLLCIGSYLLISLTPYPVLGLLGCGICGMSVGIMWPGTFSMASASIRTGGTAMFALLALAGDMGCSGGPTFVGMISSRYGDDLKKGILFALVFPMLLMVGLYLCKRRKMQPL